jgi:hypothetical protein
MSRRSLVCLPLVLTGILLAWHPADPDQAVDLLPVLGRWTAIHVGLLLALPIITLIVLTLLQDVTGRAATVSRVAIVTTTAFYAAFESLVGLGTGILVGLADRAPAAERAGAFALAQRWWEVPTPIAVISAVAIAGWVVALATAAAALHRQGGDRVVTWALVAAALLFAAGHPGLTGLAAMVCLAVATVRHDLAGRVGVAPTATRA